MAALCLPSDHAFCNFRLSAIVQSSMVRGLSPTRKRSRNGFSGSSPPPKAGCTEHPNALSLWSCTISERNNSRMPPASKNSFSTRETLQVDGKGYEIFRLSALEKKGVGHAGKLPFSLRVLLENLLRQEDSRFVHAKDIEALAGWDPNAATQKEISFMPARVLLQDFTGVPCVVDLAAMREALAAMGADPSRANPLMPADLVIDHSVQVDKFGSDMAFAFNAELEFARNRERYSFLRWGQDAFKIGRAHV